MALAWWPCLWLAICFFCLWLSTCFFVRVATLHEPFSVPLAPDVMCFFCLWLSTCFFSRVATPHESSFVTLAPDVDGLPGLRYCAKAGEVTSIAVIIIPRTVNFTS